MVRLKPKDKIFSVEISPPGLFEPGKGVALKVDPDGHLRAPRWVAAQIKNSGVEIDGADDVASVREELQRASSGELSLYLNSRGVMDHRWEAHQHYLSENTLRKNKCPDCKKAADALDNLFQALHKNGTGRLVHMTDDEKLAKALELHDKESG